MIFAVAGQGAASCKLSEVAELKHSGFRFGAYERRVEIDQMRVIRARRDGGTNTVRCVADRAGRVLFDDVHLVLFETVIAENTAALVTFVTHRVLQLGLRRGAGHNVVALKEIRVDGPVGPVGTAAIVTRT